LKTILIIGAGPNQLPAIRLARQRGYSVLVTDMDPNAVGIKEADGFGIASTRDWEQTVKIAIELNRKHKIDGVMTLASESSVTVSNVAKALGLPGLDPELAWRSTHKGERIRAVERGGIPIPRYFGAKSLDEALAAGETLGYPVVMKPADSAGSRGVRKINSPSEMTAAIEEIREISKQAEFLIEEFLTGTEHSIEGLVVDGEVFWTAFSDRNYDKKENYPPYFSEDGDTMPTSLTPSQLREMYDAATAGVHALGINWGAVKGDIMYSARGPIVFEMATRLSGDYFCNVTTPLHNGINILETLMDMSLGLPVDRKSLAPKFNHGVALRYVWPSPGVVKEIRGVEEVRAMEGVFFFNWEPKYADMRIGKEIKTAKSMAERVGCVMTHAATREEAVAIAEKAIRTVRIITD